MEKSREFTLRLPLQCRVNAVFCFCAKIAGIVINQLNCLFCKEGSYSGEFTICWPAVQGFWQGFAGRKVKVPAIPRGVGGMWLQMTSALKLVSLILALFACLCLPKVN